MVELKYTAVSRQRVVASNGCAMIPWRTILDPDHGLHVVQSACRWHRLLYLACDWALIWHLGSSRTTEQLTHSGDIEWYDTLEECKARAERILHDYQVRVD
jgi:hypothetical protein